MQGFDICSLHLTTEIMLTDDDGNKNLSSITTKYLLIKIVMFQEMTYMWENVKCLKSQSVSVQ